MPRFPPEVLVTIEVPRGSFIKRKPNGAIDFLSPFPSPFNYGSVAGIDSADGDPLDALILGSRIARGAQVHATVWGWVDFLDAGDEDPKLVCCRAGNPSETDWRRVRAFFTVYAQLKSGLNRVRGRPTPTRLRGLEREAVLSSSTPKSGPGSPEDPG